METTSAMHLKWIWSEHGTWAVLWTAFGCGLLLAWPPTWITLCTLVGLSAVAAAKVLALRMHKGHVSLRLVGAYLIAGGAALLPLLLAAPLPLVLAGAVGAPFMAVYLRRSKSPRWTRRLTVEYAGVGLMALSAGLAVLSARPGAMGQAVLASILVASLFLPGVPRARLLKTRESSLRWTLLATSLLGALAFVLAAAAGFMPWWGALGGLAFSGDLRAGLMAPRVTARHLGLILTLRNAGAALLLALAWKPF